MSKQHRVTPLDKALTAAGCSQKELAERVGVTPQAISLLKKRGGTLPVQRAQIWVKVTGLSLEELFPQLYKAA
ncbi:MULTISPECIES: helix-turn-helix domain-containing protein [Enterobacteriaceae]|uniref:helix-turn-helix domain-containing protein n=1 Tax=Enterobacteriaceae TaxID=543 RepID=UPI0007D6CFD0|nr:MULTISPECIES: helix-turn-helix transcriptional regulator [Enterobacteriaceae]HDR2600985.1 helix-turn-helix transcriptional regulator [Enterobacter hormaechei subsp. oharae]EAT6000590.1 helix-turn-helix domain-containing protein [Salmonella enterica]MBK2957191.1 helix-turn-helix domain-containing protein [Enterobacter hormaechei]MBL5927821.1 helix-turn-helix transcriptional regulator [Enterobacter asburiae]MBL5958608.1 helix-turn-helix transcriptional regulator [Enterobacter asburiae]